MINFIDSTSCDISISNFSHIICLSAIHFSKLIISKDKQFSGTILLEYSKNDLSTHSNNSKWLDLSWLIIEDLKHWSKKVSTIINLVSIL